MFKTMDSGGRQTLDQIPTLDFIRSTKGVSFFTPQSLSFSILKGRV